MPGAGPCGWGWGPSCRTIRLNRMAYFCSSPAPRSDCGCLHQALAGGSRSENLPRVDGLVQRRQGSGVWLGRVLRRCAPGTVGSAGKGAPFMLCDGRRFCTGARTRLTTRHSLAVRCPRSQDGEGSPCRDCRSATVRWLRRSFSLRSGRDGACHCFRSRAGAARIPGSFFWS